ncbi:exodeoxyribonuclease V subunit gamma [Methylophaga sp. OBS4]|uniref:exodeoxyribonuclease V subunit gamma n=1 Tax=Methylophaga sp. OBS4 TaxID=2991935 RepID=UPI00224FE4C4|nr:exodeoxyribonuclease V subunit gamma [Methylophaga sp. OBS4]MCX4186660.1 exodeoxyribonuclease V subunit gamma [Methylophaga sp. OBS4]
MLKIVYSNSARQLTDWLAEQHQSEPLPPFEAETVIVQSNELSRWLSLYLANRQGIAANLEFPFPSAYIWSLFRQLWPDIPLQSPYAKSSLAWRIQALLPECQNETGFEVVSAYLADEKDELKRYQLAERIADTFDQYLMYRPDWIAKWEQGDSPIWQGKLWFKLTADDAEPMHRAHLLQKMHQLLQETDTPPAGLPTRLSIFGISALPPVYLQTFELLARFVDITLFYLSPSEHYWGDLRDQKQLQREQLQLNFEEPDAEPEPGHPLLASLGKQGQEFFRQLQDTHHDADSCFVEPEPSSMLTELKHDIFTLEEQGKTAIADNDQSIAIHVCHSPMREIEILHDQLLAMFERDKDLTPTDIVVMTPDIDVYAPWIEAVFGTADKSSSQIPFSIADSSGQQESLLINTFYSLLQLPQSRFDVETILALLECPAVQARFGLDDAALSWIRDWCRDTRTRWGLDNSDKTALDLPANDANTWRAGLDRLLLGYAMPLNEPGQSWRLFDGQLAMDGISGERARIVAALCEFIDALDHWRQRLARRFSIHEWHKQLNLCLDAFFRTEGLEDNQFDYELTGIRTQLERLVDSAVHATFEQEIGGELILSWLQSHLEPVDNTHRFLGHGVTFCGMVPMRSIPFGMVCLIGMNDEVFPRRQPALSFDLLARDHREGDRSRRDDDRYLFLEALLSADHYLYISYVGASIVDNSEIPPSVLVSDLQDLLSERFETGSGGDILQHIVTHHPLQAFSRRYFDGKDPKLFSFNASQCPMLEAAEPQDWFDAPLPEADDSWRELTASQLARFFVHPARFLLRERLGVRLELEEDELESREPFELDGLESWQLRQWLLDANLSQRCDEGLKPLIQATGMLPQGYIGEAWFEQESQTVDDFVDKLMPSLPQEAAFSLPLDLEIDGFIMGGQLEQVSQQGLLRYRLAKKKGKDLIAAWIDHLLLNILRPEGVTLETRLILQDDDLLFTPVTGPSQLLADLLKLYWQGCHQPLAFFDKSSYEFARVSLSDKPEKAFPTAGRAWSPSSDNQRGEQDDPYYRQLYREPPLDEQFADIAMQIYSPIQQHLQGRKL